MEDGEFTFYVWNLTNYTKHFNHSNDQKIKSPIFSLSKNNRLKFCLHFYSKCPVEDFENFVALGLAIVQFDGNQEVKLDFSVWVENQINDEVLKKGIFN